MPWGDTNAKSSALTPASSIACVIATARGFPVREGADKWLASLVVAPPTILNVKPGAYSTEAEESSIAPTPSPRFNPFRLLSNGLACPKSIDFRLANPSQMKAPSTSPAHTSTCSYPSQSSHFRARINALSADMQACDTVATPPVIPS